MENYTTLTEAINNLKSNGYVEDFNLKSYCLECRDGEIKVYPDEFHIDKAFRFDVDTAPSDQAILYAISSESHNIKGLLVNGYGIYSDDTSNEIIEKLKL
ncbi:MAG: phosphoribosylpyrophosphate synthetase [Bacteroidota bacterium]